MAAGPVISVPAGQDEAYFENVFTTAWGAAAGAAYTAYAAAHPALTAYQSAEAYADTVALGGLDKALKAATTGAGTATGQAVTGAAAGADEFAKSVSNPLDFLGEIGDFFHRLTEASTWERIAEVLLGVVLLAVGLAKLTHAVPAVTKIASAVP